MKKRALILGATSDLAEALSEFLARDENYDLLLASRDFDRLETLASDLKIRFGVEVNCVAFDATHLRSHEGFYSSFEPKPDLVIVVFGYLGNQKEAEKNPEEARKIIETNYTGAVSILNIIANDFRRRGSGTIVGVSSVAGDRGRQSNYIYGSAKAGFTAYLSGLRNSLYPNNVHVITVKPGFMRTKMIEGVETPGFLTLSPERAARLIVKAIKAKKNTVYVAGIWKYIMLLIRNIPEFIFKKLRL